MNKPVNIKINTDKLIPHKEKIKFIYDFIPRSENTSESTITVKNSMFMNTDNTLGQTVIPELFSQVYAAHLEYFDKLNRGPESLGFLVGIKDLIFNDSIYKGDTLIIKVKEENEIQAFQIVSGTVYKNKEEIANCNFKIWIPEKDADVIKEPKREVKPEKLFNSPAVKSLCNNPLKQEILKSICNLKQDRETAEAVLYFEKDFTGFSGHFTDFPVLPGAVILETGKFLTEIILMRQIKILRIDNVKFSNIIMPEQVIIFKMLLAQKRISIKVFSKNTACSNILMEVL